MNPPVAELIRAWHDFYTLIGTASATLVGLMFVAASIGATIFNDNNRAGMEAFISPTVVHFSACLLMSLVFMVPSHTWWSLGLSLAAGGLIGLGYCGRVWLVMFVRRKFNVDLVDRLFYALIPVLGYVLVLIAAAMAFMRTNAVAECIAAALLVLLVAGIRNAWDMMMWIAIRSPNLGEPPR